MSIFKTYTQNDKRSSEDVKNICFFYLFWDVTVDFGYNNIINVDTLRFTRIMK